MRRPLVTLTCALTLMLAPVALSAQEPAQQQQPPTQQPPTQPPTQQPPTDPAQQQPPATPKEPRLTFTGDAGILLFTIKGDQIATFEQLVTRVREALANSEDPVRKQQLQGWKVYKASEPAAEGNALYVLMVDPVVKGAEYDPVMLVVEALGKDYATPENQEMVKKFVDVFANVNRLNLTPIAR
jgi:hypothetical protein